MLTHHLHHILTKIITKSMVLVVSTVTLAFPLVPSGFTSTPPANPHGALSQPRYIPRYKIVQPSLDGDSRSIPGLNDADQRYGWSWAKAMATTTTLASTEVFTTYLPLVFIQRPPIVNGDFEMGRAYSDLIIGPTDISPTSVNPPLNWTRFSRLGYELFFTQSSQPLRLPIPAQSGIWATWLGGDDNEISYIQQQVIVPSSSPFLVFSYWRQSYDSFCGSQLFTLPELLTDFVASSPIGGLPVDLGGVIVDNNSGVLGISVTDLCITSQTNGWDTVVINLSQYAGQSVSLQIRSKGDFVLTSSFFIDNVSLGGTSLTSSSSSFSELSFVPKPSSAPSNQTSSFSAQQEASKLLLITPNNVADMTKKGNAQVPTSSGK